jgi:uncharacterized oligopeptide transporter (OPT) family protein
VAAQFLDVVADAAHAELAEVGEVLPNLRGVEVEALGERLRRDGLHAQLVERVQAAQVDRQPIGGQLRDLFGHLPALVRRIHKVQCYHLALWRNPRRTARQRALRRVQTLHSASQSPREFTIKAILLGSAFGLLFGASTVYLGLRAGPHGERLDPDRRARHLRAEEARRARRSSRTTSSRRSGRPASRWPAAWSSPSPRLIFLLPYGPNYFNYLQITLLTLAGGILGVLMMVPLRRALIVKEHGVLPYPEGTAVRRGARGRRTRRQAGQPGLCRSRRRACCGSRCPWIFNLFRTEIGYSAAAHQPVPNATLNVDVSPEYLGVGYVIGPRIAGTMFAGGVLSWLVFLPLLSILGSFLTEPFPPIHPNFVNNPATGRPFLISEMSPGQLWSAYIRYIGAAPCSPPGLITLARTIPTIIASARGSFKDLSARAGATAGSHGTRHSRWRWCSAARCSSPCSSPSRRACRPRATSSPPVLILVFGFFFATVSSRITGLIGSSSNPISGMTIATLILTCLLFVGLGWTG